MASEEIPERFTFRLYRHQRRAIIRMSHDTGFSQAEIVRNAVDSYINQWMRERDNVSSVEDSDASE